MVSKLTYNEGCPIDLCIDIVKGKCKAALVVGIHEGKNRFSVLKRSYKISERMLAKQLEELIADGILDKRVINTLPLHVEYHLTPLGEELRPIVSQMLAWGRAYKNSMSPVL